MVINGVIVSEEKLASLMNVMPESLLRSEYELSGLSDVEIARKYTMSVSWVCKLRKIYEIVTDPRYQLRRNVLRFVSLTDYQRQVLEGTLFGDSLIAVQNSGTGYWKCLHCTAQEQLLLKLAQVFKPFIAKVFYGERPFEKGGKNFPYVCARSFALPQFTEYRQKFYPEGKKILTVDLLKNLTPTGLAYWWMDDGLKGEYSFNIVTYDDYLFKAQRDTVTEIFRNLFNLSVSITWDGEEGNICILRDSHETMWNYLEPEITNDLRYKLPKKYRKTDNQQPSLEGNLSEGSTTGGSLNSIEHGDNTHQIEAILSGMPSTCLSSGDTV